MAMLIMEGFEGFNDVADVRRRHVLIQTGVPTLETGRYGGKALKMSTNNGMYLQSFGNLTTFVIGVAIYMSGTSIASNDVIRTIEGVTECLVVSCYSGGLIYITRGTTFLGVASVGFRLNTWHYLELKGVIDNTTGTYEVRLDGVNILSDTGQDTQGGTNSYINLIQIHRQSSGQELHDDLYLLDSAGLTNNDFLGDIQIQTVNPDGDGNRNDFTRVGGGLNNYEAVDDGDTPDDDTTYNHSAVLDEDELYTHSALAGTFDTVYAISVRNHVRKENAGDRSIRALIRSNTNEAESALSGLSTDWLYLDGIFEVDPQGGGAWTETRVNACEMGMTIEA